MHLFADTHFFLHFKHAQELAWSDVTAADPIFLVVGRTVQKEIEKHKHEKRGRVQGRAKDYASKLATIALQRSPIELRANAPKVMPDFRPGHPKGWSNPADLNAGWADDMIVADALAFQHDNPAANVAILTGDPGLIATATAHGLTVISLANANWELDPEDDPLAKEIEKLRRENKDLRQTGPDFGCTMEIGDAPAERINLKMQCCGQLSEEAVEEIVERTNRRHPKITNFDRPGDVWQSRLLSGLDAARVFGQQYEWKGPSPEEISGYDAAYDEWVEGLPHFARETAKKIDSSSVDIGVRFLLTNDGNHPGEHVQVQIEAMGDFLISLIENEEEDNDAADTKQSGPVPYFAPPKAPEWKRIATGRSPFDVSGFAELRRLTQGQRGVDALFRPHEIGVVTTLENQLRMIQPAKPRDRHKFYYRDGTKGNHVKLWRLECEEFRHRQTAEAFDLRVVADHRENIERGGAIKITASARNLPRPFERTFPIELRVEEVDAALALRKYLP